MKKNKKEKSSIINLLAGKATFTNEPLWYRLIVIVLVCIFLLGALYLLKLWVIPSLAIVKIAGIDLGGIIDKLKSPRSP